MKMLLLLLFFNLEFGDFKIFILEDVRYDITAKLYFFKKTNVTFLILSSSLSYIYTHTHTNHRISSQSHYGKHKITKCSFNLL